MHARVNDQLRDRHTSRHSYSTVHLGLLAACCKPQGLQNVGHPVWVQAGVQGTVRQHSHLRQLMG